MRFLANKNFPLPGIKTLRKAGHEVLSITDCIPESPTGKSLK